MAHLAGGGWTLRHENLLITGPTGLGKSWIACALGHKACRDGRPVLYQRAPRRFEALTLARGARLSNWGRHERILKTIARMDVLIIDDRGLAVLTAPNPLARSAVTCWKPPKTATAAPPQSSPANCPSSTGLMPPATQPWPTPSSTAFGHSFGPVAVMPSLHNAHRLELTAESMRKTAARNTSLERSAQA